jgi:hypothetical protein
MIAAEQSAAVLKAASFGISPKNIVAFFIIDTYN